MSGLAHEISRENSLDIPDEIWTPIYEKVRQNPLFDYKSPKLDKAFMEYLILEYTQEANFDRQLLKNFYDALLVALGKKGQTLDLRVTDAIQTYCGEGVLTQVADIKHESDPEYLDKPLRIPPAPKAQVKTSNTGVSKKQEKPSKGVNSQGGKSSIKLTPADVAELTPVDVAELEQAEVKEYIASFTINQVRSLTIKQVSELEAETIIKLSPDEIDALYEIAPLTQIQNLEKVNKALKEMNRKTIDAIFPKFFKGFHVDSWQENIRFNSYEVVHLYLELSKIKNEIYQQNSGFFGNLFIRGPLYYLENIRFRLNRWIDKGSTELDNLMPVVSFYKQFIKGLVNFIFWHLQLPFFLLMRIQQVSKNPDMMYLPKIAWEEIKNISISPRVIYKIILVVILFLPTALLSLLFKGVSLVIPDFLKSSVEVVKTPAGDPKSQRRAYVSFLEEEKKKDNNQFKQSIDEKSWEKIKSFIDSYPDKNFDLEVFKEDVREIIGFDIQEVNKLYDSHKARQQTTQSKTVMPSHSIKLSAETIRQPLPTESSPTNTSTIATKRSQEEVIIPPNATNEVLRVLVTQENSQKQKETGFPVPQTEHLKEIPITISVSEFKTPSIYPHVQITSLIKHLSTTCTFTPPAVAKQGEGKEQLDEYKMMGLRLTLQQAISNCGGWDNIDIEKFNVQDAIKGSDRNLMIKVFKEEVEKLEPNNPLKVKWLSKFSLVHDIDKYPEVERNFADIDLTQASKDILYDLPKTWYESVFDWLFSSSEPKTIPETPIVEYREKFVKLIEVEDLVECYSPKKNRLKKLSDWFTSLFGYASDETDIRATHPEEATITMKELLGEEGLKLYKKALQEEVNSRAFRDAVFNKSTKYFDEVALKEPPCIIIAGPSACGKSYATDLFLEEVKKFPKKKGGERGIYFACVDNAIGREVSQMRKLVIRAANKLGYTGVEDIDDHGSALKDVKDIIKQTAKTEEKFGLLIPETFATKVVSSAMDEIYKLDRPVIFGSIKGSHEENFKKVVAHMGNTRAWKTEGFDNLELGLNSTEDLCESKKYVPGGFDFGLSSSKYAQEIYEEKQNKLQKPILTVVLTNDLVLKRYNFETQKWVDAKSGEEGVVKVSNKAFWEFKKFKKGQPESEEELMKFSKTIMPTLDRSQDFANQQKPEVIPELAKQSADMNQSLAKQPSLTGPHAFFKSGPVDKQEEPDLENESDSERTPLLGRGSRRPSE